MSAHTPRPLTVEGANVYAGPVENGVLVATFCNGDRTEADARLFVAAPDLLEALSAMLADYDADRRGKALLLAVVNARAAIAKARGTE